MDIKNHLSVSIQLPRTSYGIVPNRFVFAAAAALLFLATALVALRYGLLNRFKGSATLPLSPSTSALLPTTSSTVTLSTDSQPSSSSHQVSSSSHQVSPLAPMTFTVPFSNPTAKPAHWRNRTPTEIQTDDSYLEDCFTNAEKYIGDGKFGSVRITKEGQVIKCIRSSRYRLDFILKEFRIGAPLDHPNICKIHSCSYTPTAGSVVTPPVFIAMEFIDGQTISQIKKGRNLDRFTKEQVVRFLRQLQDCCRYLFDQEVIWNDLSDENMMITGDKIVLIDLGLWSNGTRSKPAAINLLIEGTRHVHNLLDLLNDVEARALKQTLIAQRLLEESNMPPVEFENILSHLLEINDINPSTPDLENRLDAAISDYFDRVIALIESAISESPSEISLASS